MNAANIQQRLDAICRDCIAQDRDEGFLYLTYRMLVDHLERHVTGANFAHPQAILQMMERFMARDLRAYRDRSISTAESALGLDTQYFCYPLLGVLGVQSFQMAVRTMYEHPVVIARHYTKTEMTQLRRDYDAMDRVLSGFYDRLSERFVRLYDWDGALGWVTGALRARTHAHRLMAMGNVSMKKQVFFLRRRAWKIAGELRDAKVRTARPWHTIVQAHARRTGKLIRAMFNPASVAALRVLKELEWRDTNYKLQILAERD